MEIKNQDRQVSPWQTAETNQLPPSSTHPSKNLLILLAVILLILVGGGFLLASKLFPRQPASIQPQVQQTNQPTPQIIYSEGQEVTIQGTVTKNDTEKLPVDGAAKASIQTANGIINIVYHPGEAECKNRIAQETGLKLKIGEHIEVYGKYSQGVIRTCDSESYYIHKEFCGDNICQEIVCTALGCTKPETLQSCPQDCQTSGYKFQPISDFKKNNFTPGIYKTEGYIVKKYTCPICPQGAQCKPCMKNNIIISEENKTSETYSLTDKDLIIFTNNPNQFTLNKKYTFTIKVLDYKSTGDSINDVELVSFEQSR